MKRVPYDRARAEVEIGSLEASVVEQEKVRIPPVLAAGELALGVDLVFFGATRGGSSCSWASP